MEAFLISFFSFIRNLFLISSLALIFMDCQPKENKEREEEAKGASPIVLVKVEPLILGPAQDMIQVLGHTEALKKEIITSPLAGRIQSLNVQEGSTVRAGETVATVITHESESILLGAETLEHQAQGEENKIAAERARQLAQSTLNPLAIKAKFAGIVSSRNVQLGDRVLENESLFTIIDLTSLEFQADIPLTENSKVKKQMPALLFFPSLPNQEFAARVSSLNPQANLTSQTFSIRLQFVKQITISSQNIWKADLPGEAKIILAERKNVFLVNKKAILRSDEDATYTILSIGTDSLAHRHSIKLGVMSRLPTQANLEEKDMPESKEMQEISGEGLVAGLKIITEGQYGLADSTQVRIIP